MSVSRKRSGFINDTRAYCYPNCNIIPKTINVAQAGPNPKSYNVTKTIFTERIQ